jgi:hypothetical protein
MTEDLCLVGLFPFPIYESRFKPSSLAVSTSPRMFRRVRFLINGTPASTPRRALPFSLAPDPSRCLSRPRPRGRDPSLVRGWPLPPSATRTNPPLLAPRPARANPSPSSSLVDYTLQELHQTAQVYPGQCQSHRRS